MFKRVPFKRTQLTLLSLLLTACGAALFLAGCKKQTSDQISFQMGERIDAGPMVYSVVQTIWRTQLGDVFTARVPQHRYLLLTLAATNSSGKPVSIPFFTLEGPNREEYRELENGQGVENWFGLLREIGPGQTKQGNIVFDAPLTSFRLRLTDGGEPGTEKFVWVEIPLRMDTDTSISTPLPGPGGSKK